MLEILPEQRRPFDVIVAVPIAAADRVGPRLEKRHHHRDRAKTKDQINDADRLFCFEKLAPILSGFRRLFGESFRHFVCDFFHEKDLRPAVSEKKDQLKKYHENSAVCECETQNLELVIRLCTQKEIYSFRHRTAN